MILSLDPVKIPYQNRDAREKRQEDKGDPQIGKPKIENTRQIEKYGVQTPHDPVGPVVGRNVLDFMRRNGGTTSEPHGLFSFAGVNSDDGKGESQDKIDYQIDN